MIRVGHGPSKLTHLSIQIHAHTWTFEQEPSVFERINLNLRSFTLLSELRISGASTNRHYEGPIHLGQLPSIRLLDLTECNLEMSEVARLLHACNNVQHFTCKWTFLDNAYYGPCELRAALLARANTLETLILDFRDIRYSPHIDPKWHMLGSLRPMRILRYLEICETGFLDSGLSLLDSHEQIVDCDLSELLPESLEHLKLLTQGTFNHYPDDVLEEAFCLFGLADNCKKSVPHLETLRVVSRHHLTALNIVAAFAKTGVRFQTEMEV